MMNDNSVSRFDDLEFKLVDPNKVIVGSDEGDGRAHMPFVEFKVVLVVETYHNSPLAWYVHPLRSHSFNDTLVP